MEYTAKSITKLSGVEAVRQNPGMFLGDADSFGMWICIKEIIDNARDEAVQFGSQISVTSLGDNSYSITDDGRGIPVDKHPKTKLPAIEMIFCDLHTGAKMAANRAYKNATSGVHGVGACVTNAFSKSMTIITGKGRSWFKFTLVDGVKAKLIKSEKMEGFKSGTKVSFQLDVSRFEKGATVEDDKIIEYLEALSRLYPKTKFTFKGSDRSETFHQKLPYEKVLCADLGLTPRRIFSYNEHGINLTLAMTDQGTDEGFSSYVCGSRTTEGGTHIVGLQRAVEKALEDFPRRQKDFDCEAFINLFSGMFNIDIIAPKFRGQTKTRLLSKEPLTSIPKHLEKGLKEFFNANKGLTKVYLDKAIDVFKMNKKHANEREMMKATAAKKGKIIYPDSLTVANCDPSKREIYVLEGKSAAGSSEVARLKTHQELMQLRGKFLNVLRNDSKAHRNEVVTNLFMAFGIKSANKETSARVTKGGKIILFTDLDDDGAHIRNLMIGFLYKYMPKAFEDGMVYYLDVPGVFSYSAPNQPTIFAKSIEEIKKKVTKFNPAYTHRFKGWGGVNAAQLRRLAFGPERKLVRIDPIDAENKKKFYEVMSSAAPETRAAYLEPYREHASNSRERNSKKHEPEPEARTSRIRRLAPRSMPAMTYRPRLSPNR